LVKKKWLIAGIVAFVAFSAFAATQLPLDGILKAEKEMQANKKQLEIVASFLLELEYYTIFILDGEPSTMYVGEEDGGIPIENKEVKSAIKHLFNRGFQTIDKKSNYVSFSMSNSLFKELREGTENGYGIVYSKNGPAPNNQFIDFLTEIKPLKEDRWFYYEEDFKEWKRRNPIDENMRNLIDQYTNFSDFRMSLSGYTECKTK